METILAILAIVVVLYFVLASKSAIEYKETRNKDEKLFTDPDNGMPTEAKLLAWSRRHRDNLLAQQSKCQHCGKKMQGRIFLEYGLQEFYQKRKGMLWGENEHHVGTTWDGTIGVVLTCSDKKCNGEFTSILSAGRG